MSFDLSESQFVDIRLYGEPYSAKVLEIEELPPSATDPGEVFIEWELWDSSGTYKHPRVQEKLTDAENADIENQIYWALKNASFGG